VSAAASPTISRMRSSRRRSGEVFGSEWGSVVSVAPSSSVSAAAVATSQSMLVVGDGEGGVRAGSAAGAEDELDADVVGDVAEVGEEWPSGLGRLPLPVTDAVRDVSCAEASEDTAADPAGVGAAVCEGAHSCAAGRWSGLGFDPAVAAGATPGDWLVVGTGDASGRTGVALRASGLHCALSLATATDAWVGSVPGIHDEPRFDASPDAPTGAWLESGVAGRSVLACVVPLSASGSGCCRFRWNHPRPPPCAIRAAPRRSAVAGRRATGSRIQPNRLARRRHGRIRVSAGCVELIPVEDTSWRSSSPST